MKYNIFIISISLLFFACKDDSKSVPIPDISGMELAYNLVEYDKLLYQLDTNEVKNGFQNILEEYPEFTNLYFTRVVPLNEGNATYGDNFYQELRLFLTDSRIRLLFDTVFHEFPDFTAEFGDDFTTAFKRIRYYFPDAPIPNVYTFLSEYAFQNFIFSDAARDGLGVGLDLFLGRDFDYKKIDPKSPSFSEYLTRTFDKDHLVKKSIEAYLNDMIGPPRGARMIDQMIHNGKKLFVLKRIFPETPDSIIIEYSSDQMDWVRKNEEEMWAFFFKEKLFYETNMMTINKYVNISPDSPGMPDVAPGRTANYMGWRIIETYMERYPETSLIELLQMQDGQKILDDSRFKPRRKN